MEFEGIIDVVSVTGWLIGVNVDIDIIDAPIDGPIDIDMEGPIDIDMGVDIDIIGAPIDDPIDIRG